MNFSDTLEQTLYHEIPLTQHMGIGLHSYDKNKLILTAPLAPNSNHKSTFFGGSLFNVAVTTGWSLLYLKQQELQWGGHVVIGAGNIEYQLPVANDVLSCAEISADQLERITRQLKRRGKAVVTLDVVLGERLDQPAVVFKGRYAIV